MTDSDLDRSKIYLGRIEGWGRIYIERHKWDCDWYWAFGYLGNKNCHFHIESLIKHPERYDPDWHQVTKQFTETWLTQDQWWILRDLFIVAYALKKAAETYRYGGHQTQQADPYRITDKGKAAELNRDLELVLNNIWSLLCDWRREFETPPARRVVGDSETSETESMATTEKEESCESPSRK